MPQSVIRVLHVEDNGMQRRLVARLLEKSPDVRVVMDYADSEAEAVRAFGKGTDCVVLDHHLTQGNGLNCLRQIQRSDPVVPVVVLSGTKDPDVLHGLEGGRLRSGQTKPDVRHGPGCGHFRAGGGGKPAPSPAASRTCRLA
jgi:CheY-like chemotaxis protein